MSNTKTCNLTENEIKQLIMWHGYNLNDEGKASTALDIDGDMFDRIERINYLNKRLKAFKEVEIKEEPRTYSEAAKENGWGTANG